MPHLDQQSIYNFRERGGAKFVPINSENQSAGRKEEEEQKQSVQFSHLVIFDERATAEIVAAIIGIERGWTFVAVSRRRRRRREREGEGRGRTGEGQCKAVVRRDIYLSGRPAAAAAALPLVPSLSGLERWSPA